LAIRVSRREISLDSCEEVRCCLGEGRLVGVGGNGGINPPSLSVVIVDQSIAMMMNAITLITINANVFNLI